MAPRNKTAKNIYYLSDRHIDKVLPLVIPAKLLAELPLDERLAEVVLRGRGAVTKILNFADDRLIAIVGPCSVHDPEAALEYARLLAEAASKHKQDLCIVMRVYYEKPRTAVGWKGLINDPHRDDSGDVNTGLRQARQLLLKILDLGLPVGCEFLDPIMPQYIADAVSWGAIGARTTESQIHRQMASGLSMPVGFKNRTDGNVSVALDALRAALASHAFTGIALDGSPAILYTNGNPDCHIILRGGKGAPNYEAPFVASLMEELRKLRLPERVIIDVSHDNSSKDHERQPLVAQDIGRQIASGNASIVGTMLESFIVAGSQEWDSPDLVSGQSITDACMSWETTEEVLDSLAEAVRSRRASKH